MPHTLAEAAKATGRDRSTILRAIRNGKLSAVRDTSTGAWLIEPAELHRIYDPADAAADAQSDEHGNAQARTGDSAVLHREVELLRERLAEKDDVISDLRGRLDREAEERRKLTMMLTDQRCGETRGRNDAAAALVALD